MELVWNAIIAWIATVYLFTNIQEKEIVRSLLIYFIFTVMIVSGFEIISMNMHLINYSNNIVKFISFIISRNITKPLLVIIFINLFYRVSKQKRYLVIALLLVIVAFLEIVDQNMQLYLFVKWNFGSTILFSCFNILIIFIISKCINAIQLRGERNNYYL